MSRTVILDDGRTVLQFGVAVPVTPSWSVKDVDDAAQFSADFVLVAGRGRTLAAVAAAVQTTGSVALGATSFAGTLASVMAAGGQDQELALVGFTVTLDDGEVLRRTVWLPVVDLMPGRGVTIVPDGSPLLAGLFPTLGGVAPTLMGPDDDSDSIPIGSPLLAGLFPTLGGLAPTI